jgi:hypothetical protein
MEKWIDFYEPFFSTRDTAADFVAACEARSDATEAAMLIMHQTQRLVSLADDIVKIRPQRDSLQVLFLAICAEDVAKLQDGFAQEGKSKSYTRKFFEVFVSSNDKNQLEAALVAEDAHGADRTLKLEEVVDYLYGIRCDVVHEGRYWEFFFCTGEYTTYSTNSQVGVRIGYSQFRDIIVRAAIAAALSRMPKTTNGNDAA